MSEEYVMTVNKNDEAVALKEKWACHKGSGILHRAFTLVLFDYFGRVLVAERSDKNRLFQGLLDASVASHPLSTDINEKGEQFDNIKAAYRHSPVEIGTCVGNVKLLDKIVYEAREGEWCEKEVCSVLAGTVNNELVVAQEKVGEYTFMELKDLVDDCHRNPALYTPWLHQVFIRPRGVDNLKKYCEDFAYAE